MPSAKRTQARLRNEDYTDRELLHLLADVSDDDGLASSEALAHALGITPNDDGRSPGGRVSTRLAWMRRYGFVESVDPKTLENREDTAHVLWRITPVGQQLMGGKLTTTVQRALDRMDPGAQVLMMRELVRHAYVEASYGIASAVRREYQHQSAKRPKENGD